MEAVLVLAMALFVATHIDTFVILVAFFADPRYRILEILIGHYLGFSIGLAGAILATLAAPELIRESAFLLGFIPLGLGIWGFRHRQPSTGPNDVPNHDSEIWRAGVVTTAGIGLSGENIAVFVPFFLQLSEWELVQITVIYLIGAGAIFLLALGVGGRAVQHGFPRWIERSLVPLVLTFVGGYVLAVGWIAA